MDSFYDVPRRAPVPSSMDKVLPIPVVPEVSMIAHNTQCNSMNPVNYGKWKPTNNTQRYLNKENCNDSFTLMSNTASIIRKQVRFQAPVFKEPSISNPLKGASAYNTNPIHNDKPHHKEQVDAPHHFPPTFNQKFNGKTFQQIYMSNMPNRHLDLSILDSGTPQMIVDNGNPKQSPSKQEPNVLLNVKDNKANNLFEKVRTEATNNPVKDMPQTYKEFLTLQKNLHAESKNEYVSDILNYQRVPRHSPLRTDVVKKGLLSNNSMTQPQKALEKCSVSSQNPSLGNRKKAPVSSSENNRFSFSPVRNDRNKIKHVPNETLTPLKYDSNTQTTNVFPNANNTLANSTKQKTDNHGVQNSDDNEPSVKDLVKIIQQQNEQLLLLQTQVSNLIERSEKQQRQIEAPSSDMLFSKKYITSTQHEICGNPVPNVHTPRKGPLSKFSIDMMTSFEVSFRRQQNEKIRRKVPDFVNHEPQIQEVTETESTTSRVLSGILPVEASCDRKRIDSSLYLQEPLVVREDCPSPEPSIKIDMNDYDSSDDETADDVPIAIYANVMDQIGKFFKNAQTSTFPRKGDIMNKPEGNKKSKNTTMSKVKEATLKHLRSIGVNLATVDDSDSSEGSDISCEYSPTEVSFAVKQLLMKYLPDEYLSKLNNDQAQRDNPVETKVAPCNSKTNLIPARPEFSFATVQYMKKYNLIENNNTNDDRPCGERVNLQPNDPVLPSKPGQILDITTLKQQPKLL